VPDHVRQQERRPETAAARISAAIHEVTLKQGLRVTRWLTICAAGLVLAGCDDPDRPFVPLPGGDLIVHSDPTGASIRLNFEVLPTVTPDTLVGLYAGENDLVLFLDTAGIRYGWAERILAPPRGMTATILRPLVLPCITTDCALWSTAHTVANVRIALNPAGPLLFRGGSGLGMFWPAGESNSYASVGMPAFAGVVAGTADTVALGPYDVRYLNGRPVPRTESEPFRYELESWVIPRNLSLPTVRGLAIRQTVTAGAVPDAVLVHLSFTNISADSLYRSADTRAPAEGITYEAAYLGFILDADIGTPTVDGTAEDDLVSYEPDANLVFTYDSDFAAPNFGAWATRPALVGLQLVERPAGSAVRLNAWVRATTAGALDWSAGSLSEPAGWRWLSATQTTLGNHPDARVGFAPETADLAADYRMLVSAGPIRLAPGETAEILVAVLLAEPVAGTYTSGTRVAPGDPLDMDRPIRQVAATLIERAQALIGTPP
jgi:hypothetical protein